MKENRTSNKSTFIVWGITFVIVGILAAVKVIHNSENNASIGWVEHKQSDLWVADYSYFTGTQTGNLQGSNTKLDIAVETDRGSLEITLKDPDENLLFSETVSDDTSFRVDVPEKVIVSVSGEEHSGEFKISY